MFVKAIVEDKLYLAQGLTAAAAREVRCVYTTGVLEYSPLADDFGPFKLSHIFRFIEMLDAEFAHHPTAKIVYCIEDGKRSFANAVFLLGAYLLLKYDASAKRIQKCFAWVNESVYEPFRDATLGRAYFFLTLVDCWRALEKCRTNEWISLPRFPGIYGKYDIDVYEHYDDPINAHMHMVVPDKIIAFKGPKDFGGAEYYDDHRGYRNFSPSYYIDIFRKMNVTAVVRLNKPEYDEADFEEAGIRHYDLLVEDGAAPSPRVVSKFLRIVDGEPGVVAVHCKGGLGRTGTLIARLLMRSHGFSAREAMAWVRIVRPGSIVGEQQHYLANLDVATRWQPVDCPPIQAAEPISPVLDALPHGRATSSLRPPVLPASPHHSSKLPRDCGGDSAPAGKPEWPAAAPARQCASFTFGARRTSCPGVYDSGDIAAVRAASDPVGQPRAVPEVQHAPPRPAAVAKGKRRPLGTAWMRGAMSAALSGSFRRPSVE